MVLAHPDDEVIFGYPLLQKDNLDLNLLMCSCGPDIRRNALSEICALRRISFQIINVPSPIKETRDWKREVVQKLITMSEGCVAIFTHNPHGEYGNPDHVLVFDLVSLVAKIPVLYTDIHIDIGWTLKPKDEKFYQIPMMHSQLDQKLYKELKGIYRSHKAWTWGEDTASECTIFRFPVQDRHS